jgi:cystathionine beta-lyase
MTNTLAYNFDQIIDRRASDSVKWNAYAADVIPMWIADMDFVSPEPVIQALKARAEHGFFGYPVGLAGHPEHLAELRSAIIAWLATRHRWRVEPEAIVFIPGVVTGFNLACKAFAGPQDAVLVQPPVYTPILTVAQEVGIQGRVAELTCAPDGSYTVDYDSLAAGLSPETRLFLLCNPHNPVGKVFQPDELARMAELCLRHKALIISDEIHGDLVYSETRHTPIAALDPEIAQSTITLMAPSKTFNLAGLQCSFAVIQNEALRKRYVEARGGLVPWVNLFGLTAGEAAYRAGGPWLDQIMPYLQDNRDTLAAFVQSYLPGVHMAPVQGTYMAWLDFRQVGLPGNVYHFFLEKARVALMDGKRFGAGGEGFARLNFACPRPLLLEALERMRDALMAVR